MKKKNPDGTPNIDVPDDMRIAMRDEHGKKVFISGKEYNKLPYMQRLSYAKQKQPGGSQSSKVKSK